MKNLGQPETFKELTDRLRSMQAGDTPLWGTMTALQMVQHLGQSYEVALGDRPVARVKGPPPFLLKFFGLRVNMRWPKNVPTTPELKRAILEEEARSISEAIERAYSRMESLAWGAPCAHAHPMFGTMKPADWLRWGYLHADHHLRQFGR